MKTVFSCLLFLSVSMLFSQNNNEKKALNKSQVSNKKEYQNPPELFNPNPYGFTHSIAVESPMKICYISGQSGGSGVNHILSSDFRAQVKEALKNLETVLKANKMTFNDVVKITLLITDHNQEKLEIWTEEAKNIWIDTNLPTSTLIPVNQLALPNMLIEIDAVAIKKM